MCIHKCAMRCDPESGIRNLHSAFCILQSGPQPAMLTVAAAATRYDETTDGYEQCRVYIPHHAIPLRTTQYHAPPRCTTTMRCDAMHLQSCNLQCHQKKTCLQSHPQPSQPGQYDAQRDQATNPLVASHRIPQRPAHKGFTISRKLSINCRKYASCDVYRKSQGNVRVTTHRNLSSCQASMFYVWLSRNPSKIINDISP